MMTMRWTAAAVAAFLLVPAIPAQEGDFPKPGPEHKRLEALAGKWDARIKCHMTSKESTGQFQAKVDLGGFFLITVFEGKMFDQPFKGRGITGYDSFKNRYTGIWVDSMSPAIYRSEGGFDKTGKVFTELLEGPDPKGKPMRMRAVTEVKDQDPMDFRMYLRGEDGKDTLMMEVAYTRKK